VIKSPCTGICALDPVRDWCSGCGRTIDEIAEWGTANEERQRAIVTALADRLVQMGSDHVSPASDDRRKR